MLPEMLPVKFMKLKTAPDVSFWAKFSELKIDKFKLDEEYRIPLWGSFSLQSMDEGKTNPLILDCTSFNEDIGTTSHNGGIVYHGYMVNTNTYESFRQMNPQELIDIMGKRVIDSIIDGTALKEPWRLVIFLIYAYSDLKKYRFHFWAAHPTPFSLPEIYSALPSRPLCSEFTDERINLLHTKFLQLSSDSRSFFTIFVSENNDLTLKELSKGVEYAQSSVDNKANLEKARNEVYFAFYDPCVSAEPGWPLRNLLCLLLWHCPTYCFTQNVKVLSVRSGKMQDSIIFTLKLKADTDIEAMRDGISKGRLVGWETNTKGKMGPNISDLSHSMDPTKLSDRAINLNLKLMKWRLVPKLDLKKVSSLRCLLLGGGTLGCSVARVLLGWDIINMTIVDSSTVSHSNTVRQSLYTHEDAVKGRCKAHAAKDALLRIRPNMNVEGVVLHIPMPGHVVGQSMMETTKEAVRKLEELVQSHDVVFLLLDSREARWLPTLLCAAMNTLAINAALGFDSYTVQRHGMRDLSDSCSPNVRVQNISGKDLGCYFCNDVTQPGNSQLDRTLDQQCTVSRPGLSQIAASLAVELLIALTQHPQGTLARALVTADDDNQENSDDPLVGLLGGVPHTIRGSLWNHEMKLTVTHRFPSCTACSTPLIKEYQQRGFDFILDACNVPNYLENLSGLEEILKRSDLDELFYEIDILSEDEET